MQYYQIFKGKVERQEIFDWIVRYLCSMSAGEEDPTNDRRFALQTMQHNKLLWLYPGGGIGYGKAVHWGRDIQVPLDRPTRVDIIWANAVVASLYFIESDVFLYGWIDTRDWKSFYRRLRERLWFDFPDAFSEGPATQEQDKPRVGRPPDPRYDEAYSRIANGESQSRVIDEYVQQFVLDQAANGIESDAADIDAERKRFETAIRDRKRKAKGEEAGN